MSNCTTKRCSKCGEEKPATTEYFPPAKSTTCGLHSHCRECSRKRIREINRKRRKDPVYRDRCKQWDKNRVRKPLTTEQKRRATSLRTASRKKQFADDPQARESHREYMRAYNQTSQRKKYLKSGAYKESRRLAGMKRRAREKALPVAFTHIQWKECLAYWNYCCAVCGHQLSDLFGYIKVHADHWIPLSAPDCPGTIVTNMICLCNDCNERKIYKMPDEWLIERYGKRRAHEILKRIQKYFDSLKSV